MFRIGDWDLLLAVLVIFILFGQRLPSLMRHLGRGIVDFREPWAGGVRFRQEPKRLESISPLEWLILVIFAGLLVSLLSRAWVWTN